MSLVTDLVEHYKSLVESGELAPEDVPTRPHIANEWGVSSSVAQRARKLLLDSGIAITWAIPSNPVPLVNEIVMRRFWGHVSLPDVNGCLNWDSPSPNKGYGGFKVDGTYYAAHRVAWAVLVGPVPDGMVIDHVYARGCRSKACVNVEHLEPITNRENVLRGVDAERWRASIQVVTEAD